MLLTLACPSLAFCLAHTAQTGLLVSFPGCLVFIENFIHNKSKNYMMLTLLRGPQNLLTYLIIPIKPIKQQLMISLSLTHKDFEASRLRHMIKGIILNDSAEISTQFSSSRAFDVFNLCEQTKLVNFLVTILNSCDRYT